MPDLAIRYLPLTDLAPYPKNARTHSPEQVQQIADSIREFGFVNPVLIDEHNTLIAGHGRVLAAQSLGMPQAPAITLEGLTAAQKRALRIADNKLALNAGWSDELLRAELIDLKIDGFDLGLTGFSGLELADLLTPRTDGLTDPDEVPDAPAEPVSQRGDVWLLGGHRLVCGDATSADDVALALNGVQPHLMVTDPPYGIGYGYVSHDDSDNKENAELVQAVFALVDVPKVWTPGPQNIARDIERFGRVRVLVWVKKFAAAGNGLGGASTWEPVFVQGYTPAKRLKNDVIEALTDRVSINGKSLRDLHSCPKPVALFQELCDSLSNAGHMIYEPFSGSGTTIIAAEMTGRACHAIEIAPQYVDVAIQRWQNFTGQQATLEYTGKTYEETQNDRAMEQADKLDAV